MYVCMYVCMQVGMYVCLYMYICASRLTFRMTFDRLLQVMAQRAMDAVEPGPLTTQTVRKLCAMQG